VMGGTPPGQSEYFSFYAPAQPGTYEIFGPGDAKFHGLTGTMTVMP